MALFQRLIWSAILVALVVGSMQSALQQWRALPIIEAAEVFESQKTASMSPAPHEHEHEHEHEHAHAADPIAEWAPADGLERTFWTWVANALHAFALALLMFAAMGAWVARRGASASPMRLALMVAAIGWISLYLWPSLGLAAEVPGMQAAPLRSRQGWWLLAATCAAAACFCAAALRTRWRWAMSAAVLALPYLVGAPQLAGDPLEGFGPDARMQLRQLNSQFAWVTAWLSLALWASLGLACGPAFGRWLQPSIAVPRQPSAHDESEVSST